MSAIIDNPFTIFSIVLVAQWCAAYLGDLFRTRVRPVETDERHDFDTVLTAISTSSMVATNRLALVSAAAFMGGLGCALIGFLKV